MARKLVAVTVASVLFAFIPFTSRGILGATFRRGNVDNNATADMTDAIRILGFLFLGSATPSCLDAADTNDSGKVDLSDAAYLLAFLFGGGKAPPEPFRDCGVDSTQDASTAARARPVVACPPTHPSCSRDSRLTSTSSRGRKARTSFSSTSRFPTPMPGRTSRGLW